VNARYKAYPDYKPSGIEWLGDVPKHWGIAPMKSLGRFSASGIDKKNVKTEPEVSMVNYTDVYGNVDREITGNMEFMTTTCPRPKVKTCAVKKGDLIFTPSSETADDIGLSALVVEDLPNTVFSYHILRFRFKDPIDFRYRKYLCNNSSVYTQFSMKCRGTTRQTLNRGDFDCTVVTIPTTAEQHAIASFLDRETGKIDRMIGKQERMIELLKEKRQAVISHAVTKGLNPNVPMKDSGIEWLGDIPEHWSLPKLIQCTSRIGDGLHSTPKYEDSTGYFFINGNNLKDGRIIIGETAKEVPETEYHEHFIHLDRSSVLLSINGTIGNVAFYSNEKIILGKSAAYINCLEELEPSFLLYYLQSNQLHHYFDLEVTGTTIFNLSLNSIRQMKVCIPSKSEQLEIVKYCADRQIRFNALIAKAEQAIGLMKERRTALISAAVTGKIDVRTEA
jgi:type I restriction enzyme S subunit